MDWLLLLAGFCVGLFGWLVVDVVRDRLHGPAYPGRRTVIVNFVDDPTQAIRGVLWEKTREHLVLRNAELLANKMAPTTLDGEIVIPRGRVAWLQVLVSA